MLELIRRALRLEQHAPGRIVTNRRGVSGETKNDTAYLDLKEKAGDVTGKAGPNPDQQWPLKKGKLDGQKLTFEVSTDDGGLLVFELSFDGESVKGDCAGTGNGGEKLTAKVNLKRTT